MITAVLSLIFKTMDKIQNIAIGAAGVVGTEVVEQISAIDASVANNWVSALVQVVIAISTVVSLFKKKKGV